MSSNVSVSSGGIDVTSIVGSLMDAARAPLKSLQTRQTAATTQKTGITSITASLATLRASAASIVSGGIAKLTSATTSAAVSTVMSSAARTGSVSFTVDRLASTHGLRTAATVAASTSVVTSASALAISSSAARFGITTLSPGAGVTAGRYTISVLQATAGASVSGTAALAASTLVDGTNNTLNLEIDGVATAVTIASGTYSRDGLVAAVNAAIAAAGGGATASLDSTNHLKLTTTHEGSTATLALPSGSALATLGLPVTTPATIGVNGSIKIGTNAAVTVTSAAKGEVVAVSTGGGNLNLSLGGGLRVGDATVAVVSTGDRSLSAVASAINNANVGVSASVVKVNDGAWLMQLSSAASGTANAISTDTAAFATAGGLVQTSTAQDAKITVGSGGGAYSVTASGNQFTDLLQGVTITANSLSATAVGVSVSRDDSATADSIDKLVGQANDLITQIATQTLYNAGTRKAAPLASDYVVRGLAASVRSAMASVVGGGTLTLGGNIGIDIQRDGTVKFDRAKFLTAMANDPNGVGTLFDRHGSGATGLHFAGATDSTVAGSYAVNITQAATRGTTGQVLVGGSVAGQTIGVRVGSTVATYQAGAGASAASIVAGLNDALAQAGLKVGAELTVGGGVKLTGNVFGGSGAFDSNLDVTGAGIWQANTGTDVAGTINAQSAIGVGQRLSLLDLGTTAPRGIKIDVDEGVIGAMGNIDYQPGIAARLVNMGTLLTGVTGGLTTSSATYERTVKDFNTQIDAFNARLVTKEANLRRQWTAVQTALTTLGNQQTWLTSQFNKSSSSSS